MLLLELLNEYSYNHVQAMNLLKAGENLALYQKTTDGILEVRFFSVQVHPSFNSSDGLSFSH